jgi:hypothetical protein
MTLNPITALSEQLQKLINEHGSAAILRDHLALFKDQVVLLEKDNTKLAAENDILKRKIEESESKINQITKDNEELRGKIQKNEHNSHGNLLDETKANILVFLAKHDKPNASQIAGSLNINEQIVKFHLTELKNISMVHDLINMSAPTRWVLTHGGRKYLIENKLIS